MDTAQGKKARKHAKRSRILVVAVLVFAVYVVVMLTQLQLEANERQAVLDETNRQIVEQTRINEDLEDKINNSDKYLEAQARKQGMARSGEMIFQESAGIE